MLAFLAVPSRADAQAFVSISVGTMPPALPAFYQPYATQPNLIWQPGYWAWSSAGYFWVPGTWVQAPQIGLLWTPGYWGWNSGTYGWYPGYWSQNVGYYGGINYGYGYYGSGYRGGRWDGNSFDYNTSVTNVNTTIVRNTYVDRSAYVNQNQGSRVSYNGGPQGVNARPSAAQVAVEHQRHYPMTAAQNQHVAVAQQNRSYLANVNHGKPNQVSVARPLAVSNHPAGFTAVKASDRAQAQPQERTTQQKVAAKPPGQHHAASAPQHAPAQTQPPARPRESPEPTDLAFWHSQ